MTLTTLVPPPPGTLFSRKKPEILCPGCVIAYNASKPTPPPLDTHRNVPRPRAHQVQAILPRLGRKYIASISSSTVTTSTDNCVSARSGADNRRNTSDTL